MEHALGLGVRNEQLWRAAVTRSSAGIRGVQNCKESGYSYSVCATQLVRQLVRQGLDVQSSSLDLRRGTRAASCRIIVNLIVPWTRRYHFKNVRPGTFRLTVVSLEFTSVASSMIPAEGFHLVQVWHESPISFEAIVSILKAPEGKKCQIVLSLRSLFTKALCCPAPEG